MLDCFTKKYPLAASVSAAPAKKVEDKKEGNDRELDIEKRTDDAQTDPKSSKPEQAMSAQENLSEKPPAVENSDAHDMPASTPEEPKTT